MTTKSVAGDHIFNPVMSNDQSSTLFLATMEALGTQGDKLSIDRNKADGLNLWTVLDAKHLDKDTNVTNHETLTDEFNALRRESNEDHELFALRFEKKVKELKYNEVEFSTAPKNLAFKLLRAMNEPIINTNVCMEFDTKTEWYENLSLSATATKAKKYVKQFKLFNPNYGCDSPSQKQSTGQGKVHRAGGNTPKTS